MLMYANLCGDGYLEWRCGEGVLLVRLKEIQTNTEHTRRNVKDRISHPAWIVPSRFNEVPIIKYPRYWK